ncbi:hypercellular protein HypA [Metarhizium album ARSEF 1941]|uniref:Geranylgeranyl transferase type-2 subunit alpha n=1 Tax=Metarhizium album (strain ARSEF 1941) TaxID=1081103 RepID=A0A0B2WPY5_METAS|nr:hypercellular protein HypA [Metarhizium album ARSEF 1941]KHN95689.1 hypercellular protein HypA [Metarhizium album ARSEF 1941]
MASHGVARTFRVRTEEQRQQDLEKIRKYRALEDEVRARAASADFTPELFQLTSKLLSINPEYYTIWNVRRRCLLSSLLSPLATSQQQPPAARDAADKKASSDLAVLQSELTFTIPLLVQSPKCYWIWNFRQWALSQAILRLSAAAARQAWQTELDLTSKMLDKDRRNFHAWSYRRLVIGRLESPELQGESMAEEEFAYTERIIRRDLSNFSAWHNRSQLIRRLLEERGADAGKRAAMLGQELDLVREALNVGPEDQSLWYYHRFLVSQIINRGAGQTFLPPLTAREKVAYLGREIDEIEELLEDYDDVKWIYESLLEYTLALGELEEGCTERRDLRGWLAKLRALDPMRMGRWDDVEMQIGCL